MSRALRFLPLLILSLGSSQPSPPLRVQVTPVDYASRVEVQVDGRPFTSYVHLASMRIPALTPIRDARGRVATREVTLEGGVNGLSWTAGGLLLGHGSVNGVDFSAQSRESAIGVAGRIVLRRIIEAVSGDREGRLSLEADWLGPADDLLLKEHTWFTFRATTAGRTIERVSRLAAVRGPVTLADSPAPSLVLFVADAFGGAAATARSAEGPVRLAAGETVRSRWVALSAGAGARRSTVALFDHPDNPGFPGRAEAQPDRLSFRPAAPIEIEAGSSRTVRYRLAVGAWEAQTMERELGVYEKGSGR